MVPIQQNSIYSLGNIILLGIKRGLTGGLNSFSNTLWSLDKIDK